MIITRFLVPLILSVSVSSAAAQLFPRQQVSQCTQDCLATYGLNGPCTSVVNDQTAFLKCLCNDNSQAAKTRDDCLKKCPENASISQLCSGVGPGTSSPSASGSSTPSSSKAAAISSMSTTAASVPTSATTVNTKTTTLTTNGATTTSTATSTTKATGNAAAPAAVINGGGFVMMLGGAVAAVLAL